MEVTDDKSTTVRVQYYAILREKRGVSEESWTTLAQTARELYRELNNRFSFELPIDSLRVAVNDEFCGWDTKITAGDSVVFIPPVAGG